MKIKHLTHPFTHHRQTRTPQNARKATPAMLHILKDCSQISVFHILHERDQLIDCLTDLFTVHVCNRSINDLAAVFFS